MFIRVVKAVLAVALLVHMCSARAGAERLELAPAACTPIVVEGEAGTTCFVLTFDLSSLPSQATVERAWLRAAYDADVEQTDPVVLNACAVAAGWIPSGGNQDIESMRIDTLCGYGLGNSGDGRVSELSVTKIVRAWHSGEATNNGMVISISDGSAGSLSLNSDGGQWQATLSVFYILPLPDRD